MATGAYSISFRTGAEEGSGVEAFHNSLNASMGTGIQAVPGSIAWVENLAKARLLFLASEMVRKMSLQFSPMTMTSFIPRWEAILNIVPSPDATLNDRRKAIGAQMKLVGAVPTPQAVEDYIQSIIGDIFVDTIKITSATTNSHIPGGLVSDNGVNIPNGEWSSSISYVPVRVKQPITMTDGKFYDTVNNFSIFLSRFMPSYIQHGWGRYTENPGLITIASGQAYVQASGADFFSQNLGALNPGEEIEFYDDLGQYQTFKVLQITGKQSLVFTNNVPNQVTSKPWKRIGFYLDQTNLDNAFFSPDNFALPPQPIPPKPTVPDLIAPVVSITSY